MVDELEDMTKKLSTLGKKGQKCVIS
jgi:hypothetical protein